MGQQVPVRVGDTEFFVEVADVRGPKDIGLQDAFSLDGVRDTITAVAGTLAQAWERVRPAEASVEFGLNVKAVPGRLTGLLVEGGGEASLKVTLTWRAPEQG